MKNSFISFIKSLLIFLLVSQMSIQSYAANIESFSSGSWHASATWIGGVVPTGGDNVIIKPNHLVTLSDARSCLDLSVASNATLTISSSGSLTQTGSLDLNGTLNLSGILSQNGSLTVNGVLNMHVATSVLNQSQAGVLNGTMNTSINYSFGFSGGFSGPGILVHTFNTLNFNAGSSMPNNLSLSAGTVNVNISHTWNNLTFASGTLSGSGDGTVNGVFNWTAGTLVLDVILGSGGTLALTTSSPKTLSGDCILRIYGTGTQTNTHFNLFDTSKLVLESGSVWTMISNVGTIILGNSPTATIELNPGSTLIANFGNSALRLKGQLDCDGAAIIVNGVDLYAFYSGISNIHNTSITMNGGSFRNWEGTCTMSNVIANGTGTFVNEGATVNFNAGSFVNTNLSITAGTFNDNVGIMPGFVNMTGGTYSGTGNPIFSNKFYWTNGLLGGSGIMIITDSIRTFGNSFVTRIIQDTRSLRLQNNAKGSFGSFVIKNAGLFEVTGSGTAEVSSSITLQNNAKVEIDSGGVLNFNITSNTTNSVPVTSSFEIGQGGTMAKNGNALLTFSSFNFLVDQGSIVVNAGTLSMASSTAYIYNNGSIQINNGVLQHAGPVNVTNTAFIGSGNFKIQSGTTSFLTGSSLTCSLIMEGGTLTSGVLLEPITILMTNGTINGSCNIHPGSVTFNNGTIANAGNLNITGPLIWNGGTIGSTPTLGQVNVFGFTTMTTSASKKLLGKSMFTHGSSSCNQGAILLGTNAILNVPVTTTFTLTGISIIKDIGTSGTVSVQNSGTINKTGNGTLLFSSCDLINNGLIQGTGSMQFNSAVFTNAGEVSPGASPGILSFNRFSNSGSSLIIEVEGNAGAGVAGGHDQLNVTALPEVLGGTLDIRLINSFVPASGQTYTIATLIAGYSPASFNQVITQGLPPGWGWTIAFNPTSITITFCPVWYVDADTDGYGNGTTSIISCSQPGGYVSNDDDCNDSNPAVNPAAIEICNNELDDNCNGHSDDEDLTITGQPAWYADSDGDGYGDASSSSIPACIQPSGFVGNNDDCNDDNAQVNPASVEVCNNNVDDDCDGLADDADPSVTGQSTWYADTDSDGFGDEGYTTLSCAQPTGYVVNSDDCDDDNESINPGAQEICNNEVDDDCDSLVDDADPSVTGQNTWYADSDGDGYGDVTSSILACVLPSGYVSNDDDCDDEDGDVNPGATEICNNDVDDDCDELTDDADPSVTGQTTWYADSDGDGYGDDAVSIASCDQPAGYVSNEDDCDDADPTIYPGQTEVCNDTDDDCDGLTDDADPGITGQLTWYQDNDGDEYGNTLVTESACYQPSGYVGISGDCDDSNPEINPAAEEVCNDEDDNCNEEIDERLNCDVDDEDGDGINDDIDNCPMIPNAGQEESDCDSVGDACDICPGGDDTVDYNNDGRPDCKFPPPFAEIIPEWKCSSKKVFVCHQGSTTCINYNALWVHISHGDYLGPCSNASCAELFSVMDAMDISYDENQQHEAEHFDSQDLETTSSHKINVLENEIQIYPNPTKRMAYVASTKFRGRDVILVISDIFGNLITKYEEKKVAGDQLGINVHEFPNGIYNVNIYINGTMEKVIRLVVIR